MLPQKDDTSSPIFHQSSLFDLSNKVEGEVALLQEDVHYYLMKLDARFDRLFRSINSLKEKINENK